MNKKTRFGFMKCQKTNEKGFTLIELLTVIVILAIVALIAVPIVFDMIEKARSRAAKSSAYRYINELETYVVTSKIDNKNTLEKSSRYNVTKSTTINGKTYEPLNNLVKIKGSIPKGSTDYIVLDDKKNVKSGRLTINNYIIIIKDGNIESVTKNDGTNQLVEVEDITLTKNNINISVNEKYEINAEVLPENATDKVITYTSEDLDVAEVDSTGTVTGKKIGTTNIILKASNNKTVTLSVTVIQYLADAVEVGDYVAYDAGMWTETVAKPTSSLNFGGYTKDQNKANSVETCYGGTVTLKGWRVLKVDANTKTVTIVHAGQPECYQHGFVPSTSITKLDNRATSEYLNSDYATSAHNMLYSEAVAITGKATLSDNTLRTIGGYYWLSSTYGSSYLRPVYNDGSIGYKRAASCGIRPVVVLKSNILTAGKGTDMVGQEAWTLVKP